MVRSPSRLRCAGITVVEMSFSAAAFGVLLTGAVAMLQSSDGMFSHSLLVTQSRRVSAQAIEIVARELEQADPAGLTIDNSQVHGDLVLLQVPLSVEVTGVVWGAERVQNGRRVTYPDHSAQYLLVPGNPAGSYRLLRRVIAPGGGVVAEDELADPIDGPGKFGKGFIVRRVTGSDNLVEVRLRKRISPDPAQPHTRTWETTVRLQR